MRNSSKFAKLGALVVSAATIFALAACGSTNSGQNAIKSEPAVGTPANYKGTLPMPTLTGVHNNPKSRDQLKDNGSITYGTTEVTSDWNNFSVNGNTTYMNTYWSYYMPVLFISSADGGTMTPNKNYISAYKETKVNGKQTLYITFSPKAKWNDGRAIDWTAVKAAWTVQSGKNKNYTPAATNGWDQVESVKQGSSAKQAVVTMSKPYYPATSFINVYPPQAQSVKAYTSGWVDNPHSEWGAGPYIIKTHSDSRVVFTPNPKWWGNKPKMTTVTYRVLDSQAEINAFKNGEIDVATISNQDDRKSVSTMKNAQIRRGYSPTIADLVLNAKVAPLNDIQVRKAFIQAVDRTQLAKIQFAGLDWTEKVPGSLLMTQTIAGYEDNMPKEAAFNTANAKKTLEADGYKLGSDGYYAKKGKTLTLSYTTFGDSSTTKARGLAIQKMLKAAGVKVEIDNHPASEFSSVVTSGKWTIMGGLSWSGNQFSYMNGVQLYGSESGSNYSFVGKKSIDQGFAKVATLPKREDQVKQANKTEKEALKLYAQLPYFCGPQSYVVKKGLANVGPSRFKTVLVEDIGWVK